LGIVLGGFGAIALAFACDYLTHTIKTPHQIEERLGLPVLAYVPHTQENTICPTVHENRFSYDDDEDSDPVFEQWDIPAGIRGHYEELGKKILSTWGNNMEKSHVLAIMSSHHSGGVSTVAANLAAMLARCGNAPVLLVDANFMCPSLHSIFDVRATVGLLDVLSYEGDLSDFIWPLPLKNLSLLPAGTLNENLSEMGDPSQIAGMLDRLKEKYRYIVIDIPPVDEVDWAARLAGECDGVGLVVEANKAHWDTVQEAKERLIMSNANILGVVLNKRRTAIPAHPYGHYSQHTGTVGLN
jgi:capsular exopolysaccharide synthesis family protein